MKSKGENRMKKIVSCVLTFALIIGFESVISQTILLTSAGAANNIVANGDFEQNNLNSWTPTANGFSVSGADKHEGTYSLNVNATSDYRKIYQIINVEPYTNYNFTFWFKGTTSSSSSNNFSITTTKDAIDTGILKGGFTAAKTYSSWTQKSVATFNSGNNTTLYLYFMFRTGAQMYIDDISVTETTVVKNGDFEGNNLTGWTYGPTYTVSSAEAHTGTYSVYANCTSDWKKISQAVTVAPNTDYRFTFWYKGTLGSLVGNNLGIATTADGIDSGIVKGELDVSTTYSDWTQNTIEFNSGENTTLYLILQVRTGAQLYIDDISIKRNAEPEPEPDPSIVKNSDFETGDMTGWTPNLTGFSISNEDKHSGTYSLKLTSATWKKIYQVVTVEADTDYTLSFWYKGTTGAWANNWSVTATKDGVDTGIVKGSLGRNVTIDEWTQKTVDFNSGRNTTLYLYFQTNTAESQDYALYIDDVVIDRTPVYTIDTADTCVSFSPNSAKRGDIVTVTVNPPAGKQLSTNGLKYILGEKTSLIYSRVDSKTHEAENITNQFTFTMPAGNVSVVATYVDTTQPNIGLLGASIRYATDTYSSGLQFGSRVYRRYTNDSGTAFALFSCGTLLMREDAVGSLDLTNGTAVEEWIANNPTKGKKVACTQLLDRCDDFLDYAVRLVNVTENSLGDKQYIAITYATYHDGSGNVNTVYSNAVARSYNGVVSLING